MSTLAQWREVLSEQAHDEFMGETGTRSGERRYYHAEMVDLLEAGERAVDEKEDVVHKLRHQVADLEREIDAWNDWLLGTVRQAAISGENEQRLRLQLPVVMHEYVPPPPIRKLPESPLARPNPRTPTRA